MIWDDELLFDVAVKQIVIQINQFEIMLIQQHIMQCVLVADDHEKTDDVLVEMQQHEDDEIDEKHKIIVVQHQKRQQIDIIDEMVLNENLVQETIGNVEVDDEVDDGTLETDEMVDGELDDQQVIITQEMVEMVEMVEMLESGEDDEIDDIMEADMLHDNDEMVDTDIFDEMDEVLHDEEIVCHIDTLEHDETESSNDEMVEKVIKQCEQGDDNDEMQSIICIDSDYMHVKFIIMWFVQNDDNDETVVVIACQVHIHHDDEIDDVEQMDEKYLFDIIEALHNERWMWADDHDDNDEVHLEVEMLDALEQVEMLDVVWFVK